MNTQQAIAFRIRQLCSHRSLTPHRLAVLAGLPPSTLKSILYGESQNPGAVTIAKLCGALDITLAEFFSEPYFDPRSHRL